MPYAALPLHVLSIEMNSIDLIVWKIALEGAEQALKHTQHGMTAWRSTM